MPEGVTPRATGGPPTGIVVVTSLVALAPGTEPTPSSTTSPNVPSIPDGVYRTTITKSDLYRFDQHFDPGAVDDSTGTTTIFLRGGVFRFVTDANHPIVNPLAAGTYTGSGDRVVFNLLASGGNMPTTPPMRWTFDGHALHLHFLSCRGLHNPHNRAFCQDAAILYEAHPWVKVA